jgi:hypothetical protein
MQKRASWKACQAAPISRLCSGSSWELTANLVIDKGVPETGKNSDMSYYLLLPEPFLIKTLLHKIDKYENTLKAFLSHSFRNMRRMQDRKNKEMKISWLRVKC